MDGTLIIIIDDRRSPWMKPMTMANLTKPIVIFNSGGWIGSASLTFIAPRNNNICKKNQIAGRWFDIIIRNAQVNRAKKITKMVVNNNPMWMSGIQVPHTQKGGHHLFNTTWDECVIALQFFYYTCKFGETFNCNVYNTLHKFGMNPHI